MDFNVKNFNHNSVVIKKKRKTILFLSVNTRQYQGYPKKEEKTG